MGNEDKKGEGGLSKSSITCHGVVNKAVPNSTVRNLGSKEELAVARQVPGLEAMLRAVV